MKKILLGLFALSTLAFGQTIEDCRQLKGDVDLFGELVLESSKIVIGMKKDNLSLEELTQMNDNLYEKNHEIETICDHLMYYHFDVLPSTTINAIRKMKVEVVDMKTEIIKTSKMLKGENNEI